MSYLSKGLEPIPREVKLQKALEILKDVKFDAIVGTGLSGAVYGTLLAHAMKKPLVLIRKPHDQGYPQTHGSSVEGVVWEYSQYLFVDDLIDTGATQNRVLETVQGWKVDKKPCRVVGSYLFNSESFYAHT